MSRIFYFLSALTATSLLLKTTYNPFIGVKASYLEAMNTNITSYISPLFAVTSIVLVFGMILIIEL